MMTPASIFYRASLGFAPLDDECPAVPGVRGCEAFGETLEPGAVTAGEPAGDGDDLAPVHASFILTTAKLREY